MDNATLMYVVVGLLFIFFVVMLVFSAKSWRVLHLITAFLVCVAAGALVFMTAATLRTHREWRSVYNALVKKVAEQEAEHQKLLVGELTKVESEVMSLRRAEAELQRVMMDRGRVWRGAVPDVGADSITLSISTVPAAPPAEGEAAAEPPAAEAPPAEAPPADAPPAEGEAPAPAAPAGRHGIEANTIVYGFLEGESPLSGALKGNPPFAVPLLYLGEFRVTNRTDTTITVQPTSRLTPLQQASLGEGNWTLYDNMPVDAQYVFDGLGEEDLKALFPQERMTFSDQQYQARIAQLARFFEGKTPAEVAAIIPRDKVLLTDAEYNALIQQYLTSGKEVANPDDFPPSTIWREVNITAPVSIQVDAVMRDVKGSTYTQTYEITAGTAVKRQDGTVVIGETALITSQPGDTELGQMRLALTLTESLKKMSDYEIGELWDRDREPPLLKALTALKSDELEAVLAAKSVDLDVGDVAVVHPETAKFLVDNKLATMGKAFYMRPLRDYSHYFNDSHRQELLFEDSARVIKQDTETLLAANAKAVEQVTYRSDEIAKLQADRDGFQREQAAITAVAEQAAVRNAAVRARLSELYKNNLELVATIKSLQLQWAAKAQQQQPSASPPPTTTPPAETVSAP